MVERPPAAQLRRIELSRSPLGHKCEAARGVPRADGTVRSDLGGMDSRDIDTTELDCPFAWDVSIVSTYVPDMSM